MEKDYHSDNKAFVMYKEWEQYFSALDSTEDAGRLIKALFAYAARNEEPDFSGNLKMAFMFMKNRIDEDGRKWENKCAANAKNIKKRWKKQDDSEDTDNPTSNDSDDTSSDKIKDENTIEVSISEASDKIYSFYPRKEGKAKGYEYIKAYLKNGRNLSNIGKVKLNHEQIICAVMNYAMNCRENNTDTKYIQQFSTFMNKTIIDHLEESREGYEEYMKKTYGSDWDKIKFIYK